MTATHTTTQTTAERLEAQRRELEAACEPMSFTTWKAIKSAALTAIVVGSAYLLTWAGADPTIAFLGIIVFLAIFFTEVKEVAVAGLTAKFFKGNGRSRNPGTDDGDDDRGMLDLARVLDFIRTVSSRTTDKGASYIGFLSNAAEWHAIQYGLPLGAMTGLALLVSPEHASALAIVSFNIVLAALGVKSDTDAGIARALLRQIRRELHYYLGSWLVGIAPFVHIVGLERTVASLQDVAVPLLG